MLSTSLHRVGVRALLEYLGHPDPAFTFRPDITCFASCWPAAHRQARSRGGHLPGDRRPAPRGFCAEQPRQRPAGGAAVWRGDHRAPGRGAIFRETGDRHREGVALRNLERDRAARRET